MKLFLKPGEIFIGKIPTAVMTILGSCVSVTMFCKKTGIGGICHALLPRRPSSAPDSEELRYVDSSIIRMLNEFRARGINFDAIEIKVFGGADVLPTTAGKTVGRANIESAFRTLKKHGFKTVVSDVGGRAGRKIVFSTDEGYVRVKKLKEQYHLNCA